MENKDKGLTVPKWVLINGPRIPRMPQNLSAQFVCLSPKVWDFDEKELHWASVVRGSGFATAKLAAVMQSFMAIDSFSSCPSSVSTDK